GLGDASASAHATEGLGNASAPAHATEGLGDASTSAPSLQAFQGFSEELVLVLASEPRDEGFEEERRRILFLRGSRSSLSSFWPPRVPQTLHRFPRIPQALLQPLRVCQVMFRRSPWADCLHILVLSTS
ncbi:hypothetical protein GOODEAATRI_012323, partial [Goodea atripinnis]